MTESEPKMSGGPSRRLFVDVGSHHRRKLTEHACGDVFVSRRLSEEGRLIAVLSDGLGSGVKANILAEMTATMALRFTAVEQDILRSAEVIMDSLPICQVRQISYATFTIIDCHAEGKGRIVEEGNPEFIHLRNATGFAEEVPEPEKQVLPSTKWPDRKLLVSSLQFVSGDRLILCSDGVTQAGLGSDACPRGWRRSGLLEFVRQRVQDSPELPSRQFAKEIVEEAIRHEPGNVAKDDTSAVVFHFRNPRRLLLWSGPPYEKGKDREYALKFAQFPGRKVLSGGTTANIASRELGRDLVMRLGNVHASVPSSSEMEGVDLVTEGVLTLAKTIEYLEENEMPSIQDSASALAEILLDSDEIEFMIGSRINEAHFDPTLPIHPGIRRNLIDRLVKLLRQKYLRDVTVLYI